MNRRVFKAYDVSDPSHIVALKKIELSSEREKDGVGAVEQFPITALREIMILKRLSHPCLVQLLEVVISKSSRRSREAQQEGKNCVFLVFEYMEHDLFGLSAKNVRFSLPQLKCILQQILAGLQHLHSRHIIHRDLKSGLTDDQPRTSWSTKTAPSKSETSDSDASTPPRASR